MDTSNIFWVQLAIVAVVTLVAPGIAKKAGLGGLALTAVAIVLGIIFVIGDNPSPLMGIIKHLREIPHKGQIFNRFRT